MEIKSLRKTAEKIQEKFIKNKWNLAVVESCTGGFISNVLTDIPGSSAYFAGSVVAYSNEFKTGFLKVSPNLIKKHGAVSIEAASRLAEGMQKATGAAWTVSITGIAGPGGGTKEKPVGLVYAALDYKGRLFKNKFKLCGSRLQIKQAACKNILEWLLRVSDGIS